MNTSKFNEMHGNLPFANVGHEQIDGTSFGLVPGNEGSRPDYLVRPIYRESDYHLLDAHLILLEECGVKVIERHPFIAGDNQLCTVSPRLDGPRLDHWAECNPKELVSPILIDHACKLADYFINQLPRNEGLLGDIVSPFQYRIDDSRPVLVDIDSCTDNIWLQPPANHLDYDIGSHLVDIGQEYGELLSRSHSKLLNQLLDTKFHEAVGKSIFVEGDETNSLDTEQYDLFI